MYNVGDRWVWRDNENPNQFRNKTVRGYISELKPGNSIIIKWDNGRMIQYNQSMIEEEPRLSYDKEYYRNQKLELLGI
jgi:hypothetical protein